MSSLSIEPSADRFVNLIGAQVKTLEVDKYVGIDVSKTRLDVYVEPCAETLCVSHDEDGISEITYYLQELGPTLIVLEATGGLEVRVAGELAAKGLPIVIIDPRQARNYAIASGQIAACDVVGAEVLSRFARLVSATVTPLNAGEVRSLDELLTRRRELSEMRLKESTRLSAASWIGQKSLLAHINWLDKCCAEIDADLAKRLRASQVWRTREDLLKRVAPKLFQRQGTVSRFLATNSN